MKRSSLQRHTPLRPKRKEPMQLAYEQGDAAELMPRVRAIRRGVYGGTTSGPIPKTPSTRSDALRKLAEGEECCGCLGLVCAPNTTVWAHPNGLADNKGRGYKAHDHLGAFLGFTCHLAVDKPDDAAYADALFSLAQERTRERLRAIAGNPLLKPWRVEAARWALDEIGAVKEKSND
jgi:hypothetical protein